MKKVIVSLLMLALATSAFAADIAKGPAVVDGTVTNYASTMNRGDAAVVNIIDGTFTDHSAYYMAGLTAAGFTPDNHYDPMGTVDYSIYTYVVVSTSDNWWAAVSYPTEIPLWGAYMDAGGKMFLAGQDFLWGSGDVGFAMSYFGLTSETQDIADGALDINWTGTDVLSGQNGVITGGDYAGDPNPCFGSNGWYTDDVSGAFGLADWDQGGAVAGGGTASATNVFSVLEFACSGVDIVGTVTAWGSTATETNSLSAVKALY